MKAIQLTPQQRDEIEQRRRHAQDRRVYQRLSAVLWSDAGRPREEIADLVRVSTRQVGQWLRIFRNKGLDELCTLHYRGDPGKLRPAQVEHLKHQIAQGVFHNAEQVRTWAQDTFGVAYSATGIKELFRRIGASYHKVSGFFWKADVEEQKRFVRKYRRHKRETGPGTRRYFVDACHPVWGVELLYSCWLLVGQRFYVGVGNGRKRLNILGAYCPEDHDYVDLRLTKENITGEQFISSIQSPMRRAHHTRSTHRRKIPSDDGITPGFEGLLIDPDGQRAPVDEGLVVLPPVADAVGRLRGGLASGRIAGAASSARGAGPAHTQVYGSPSARQTPS